MKERKGNVGSREEMVLSGMVEREEGTIQASF